MQRTPAHVAFRRPWPGTRRGLKLWLISIVIGLKGVGYVLGKSPTSTDSALRLVVTTYTPIQLWGAVIVVLCCVAAFTSYCHMGRDRYGYSLLVAFSASWATAYAVAPLFLGGPSYALQGSLSWLLTGAVLVLCAGDADVKVEREDDR